MRTGGLRVSWFGGLMAALLKGASFLALMATASIAAPERSWGSDLAKRYAGIEASFVSTGRLRQDPRPADAPYDGARLLRSFEEIALRHEYGRGGDGRLMRWEDPVRLGLRFGASVGAEERREVAGSVARYARRLSGITGHSITMTTRDPNFQVLMISDAERRQIGPFLRASGLGLNAATISRIERMPPSVSCLVVALPHADGRRGYRGALAILRAEHGPLMRRACMEEELAQGLGLPNDCRVARPSIFNDDEEFGVLTAHDEALLDLLYDPALSSGMSASEALRIVRRLTS